MANRMAHYVLCYMIQSDIYAFLRIYVAKS